MNQESEPMVEQNPDSTSQQSYSLDDWQTIIQEISTSPPQLNPHGFKSDGKWQFELKGKQLKQIHTHIVDLIKNQFGLQDDSLQIQLKQDITNIKQVFQFVGIQSQLKDENLWRQHYGIWQVSDFRVLVKDGNTTIVDFKNKSHHFVLFYQTSLIGATF